MLQEISSFFIFLSSFLYKTRRRAAGFVLFFAIKILCRWAEGFFYICMRSFLSLSALQKSR